MTPTIEELTRQELIAVPLPSKSKRYTPLPNKKVLEMIDAQARAYDLKLKHETFRAAERGNIVTGKLGFELPDENGLYFEVAFINSYNRKRSFGIATGAMVSVCTNSMLRGSIKHKRIHTGEHMWDDVETLIHSSIDKHLVTMRHADVFRRVAMSKTVDNDMISYAIGKLYYEDRTLSSRHLNRLVEEMKNSEHFAMNTPEDMTAWNFYNNITETMKKITPRHELKKLLRVTDFFEEHLLGRNTLAEAHTGLLIDG